MRNRDTGNFAIVTGTIIVTIKSEVVDLKKWGEDYDMILTHSYPNLKTYFFKSNNLNHIDSLVEKISRDSHVDRVQFELIDKVLKTQ